MDPWKSALRSVLIDINGNRDFAVQLNGSSERPGTPVDRVSVIYGRTLSPSLDYATAGAGIHPGQKARADWGSPPSFTVFGRREKIRTSDPYHPKVVRYQAAPRAVN